MYVAQPHTSPAHLDHVRSALEALGEANATQVRDWLVARKFPLVPAKGVLHCMARLRHEGAAEVRRTTLDDTNPHTYNLYRLSGRRRPDELETCPVQPGQRYSGAQGKVSVVQYVQTSRSGLVVGARTGKSLRESSVTKFLQDHQLLG